MIIYPKKRFGQSFLAPGSLAENIVTKANFEPSDRILEVGPGLGALTVPLARAVELVLAIEKDPELITPLGDKLRAKGLDNVTIIVADILRFDLSKTRSLLGDQIKIIANLPYNISTPFLLKLLAQRTIVERAILMFQKEFGERLIAPRGTKSYGIMTLLVRYCATTEVLLRASKNAFWPIPKVDSILVELDFRKPYPGAGQIPFEEFRKVVRAAFAQRRKTIVNSLASSLPGLDKKIILHALEECGLSPHQRAETLTMDEFLALTSILSSSKESLP